MSEAEDSGKKAARGMDLLPDLWTERVAIFYVIVISTRIST